METPPGLEWGYTWHGGVVFEAPELDDEGVDAVVLTLRDQPGQHHGMVGGVAHCRERDHMTLSDSLPPHTEIKKASGIHRDHLKNSFLWTYVLLATILWQ